MNIIDNLISRNVVIRTTSDKLAIDLNQDGEITENELIEDFDNNNSIEPSDVFKFMINHVQEMPEIEQVRVAGNASATIKECLDSVNMDQWGRKYQNQIKEALLEAQDGSIRLPNGIKAKIGTEWRNSTGIGFNDNGDLIYASLDGSLAIPLPNGSEVNAINSIMFHDNGSISKVSIEPSEMDLPSGEKGLVNYLRFHDNGTISYARFEEPLANDSITREGTSYISEMSFFPNGNPKEIIFDRPVVGPVDGSDDIAKIISLNFYESGYYNTFKFLEPIYLSLPNGNLAHVTQITLSEDSSYLSAVWLGKPAEINLPNGESAPFDMEVIFNSKGDVLHAHGGILYETYVTLPTGDEAEVYTVSFNDAGQLTMATLFPKGSLITVPGGNRLPIDWVTFYDNGKINKITIASDDRGYDRKIMLPNGDDVYFIYAKYDNEGRMQELLLDNRRGYKNSNIDIPAASRVFFNEEGQITSWE